MTLLNSYKIEMVDKFRIFVKNGAIQRSIECNVNLASSDDSIIESIFERIRE